MKKKCQIYVCEKFKVYANFQTQKVSILTDIPWPRKLDAETHIQEKVDKRDESVKVNILECIFWFRNLTVTFRISVVWNEIRIGDKKTGLRRILSRFIVWSLWHQLIIIVLLGIESNHQDQCQGGSGRRKSLRRASAKVIIDSVFDGFFNLNWCVLFSPKIILQIHELIHTVKTPGRGSLGD